MIDALKTTVKEIARYDRDLLHGGLGGQIPTTRGDPCWTAIA